MHQSHVQLQGCRFKNTPKNIPKGIPMTAKTVIKKETHTIVKIKQPFDLL